MKKLNKKFKTEKEIIPIDTTFNKISLISLKKWFKEKVPRGSKDICLEIKTTPVYSYISNELIYFDIELLASYKKEIK